MSLGTDILKILGLCLTSAVLCVVLKQRGSEYSLLITAATGIFIGIIVLNNISAALSVFKSAIAEYGIKAEYFKTALKAVGIGYITSFAADICRDSGQAALASKAELAGKSAIFILSVPLIMSVLETAVGFLK